MRPSDDERWPRFKIEGRGVPCSHETPRERRSLGLVAFFTGLGALTAALLTSLSPAGTAPPAQPAPLMAPAAAKVGGAALGLTLLLVGLGFFADRARFTRQCWTWGMRGAAALTLLVALARPPSGRVGWPELIVALLPVGALAGLSILWRRPRA